MARATSLLRLAVTGGALTVLAGTAGAQDGDFVAPPLELIEAGIFCPIESSESAPAPDTERGFIDLIEGDVTADFLSVIAPGELDMGFGIRYKLVEGAGSAQAVVTTIHPPFGTPPVSVERWTNTIHDDSASLSLFRFDDAYEIALGEWRFEISVGGEVLLRQTFFVIPPEDSLIRLDKCAGPATIS